MSIVIGACPSFTAGVRGFTLPGDTLVQVVPEGEPPVVVSWSTFLTDNADDDTLDFQAMARALVRGETWYGGGGAEPTWSLRIAP